ncbi:helix-turn-helix domain-containing protein [Cereibacter sphaeroides]|uniref:helix-turn-helix domain-containing protein n=1 Tax=Cereibacter sphaeroides TaxID=1063 RepID=UPI001F366B5B|nr:helix-turn-helix transcriptional regulator [Cereibacter sphaeroides]MCE6959287.1 helix-turn-helix domain-containing protein [Cereibacter sphaeroides]MCE6972879.1 helix-turn-helix domain-containing protein [Cereibacter sphaeroides]
MSSLSLVQIFRSNLERLISAHGTTRTALALKCGLSQSAIHDILAERAQSPKLDTVEKIADGLGVAAVDLLQDPGRREAEGALLEAIRSLSCEDLRRLTVVAQQWSAN